MTVLAHNLILLMKINNMPKSELAEKTGISRQMIYHYIDDKCKISANHLKKLADYFGLTMDELFSKPLE